MTESNETQAAPEAEPAQVESAPAEPASTPAAELPAAQAEKPRPGKFQRFLRLALIYLVAVAAVFLAGALTYHFTRYQPLRASLTQTQADLAQANQALSAAQTSLAAASSKMTALGVDNQALQSDLDAARAQALLLRVLVDVKNARLALDQEDVVAAKAALTLTPQSLADLLPSIAKYDASLAQSLPQRLNLIINGLDRDVETAKIDLDLFTKDLTGLQVLMFGG
jgi:hypothetical protein